MDYLHITAEPLTIWVDVTGLENRRGSEYSALNTDCPKEKN